jgi:CDP-6-deoxy-D-xylo-4-hexulose-3-dehydrase
MSITYENIKNAITDKTVGLILVHCLGFNAMDDRILDLTNREDLFFIEDGCESHGAIHGGRKIGTFGDLSNFSFYFGHHITTIEGGMVCTNDERFYQYAKLFRSHGLTRETSKEFQQEYIKSHPELNPLFTFAVPGYNVRNQELNAVLGLSQLERLDYNIKKRQENFKVWIDNLDSNKFYTQFEIKGNSNFALPLILTPNYCGKLKIVHKILEDEDVEYRQGTAGGGNQARQPYMDNYNCVQYGNLYGADYIHSFGLYIGNHPELEKEQIKKLCKKLSQI